MYVVYLLIFLVAVGLLTDAKKGILLCLVVRPIIDCFWEAKYSIGLRPPEIISVVLPFLVFFRILIARDKSFTRAPLGGVWIVFIFSQLLSALIIATAGHVSPTQLSGTAFGGTETSSVMDALEFFARAFNGFIGFYLFQEFFSNRKDFRLLLLALLVAGIFPLAQSVYMNLLGGTIRLERTIGGMTRSIGFYHDSASLRLYTFQALAATLLYLAYFSGRKVLSKAALYAIGLVSAFTIFRLLSKAGIIIAVAWLLIWNGYRKNFVLLGVVVVLVPVLMLATGATSYLKPIETEYSQEADVLAGRRAVELSLSGRWAGWIEALQAWERAPTLLKIMGMGDKAVGLHNDFLRSLVATGIVGLLLYLTLLALVGKRLFIKCTRDPTPLNILGVMLYVMWWVDGMGLVPGAYTSYQWFVWGFIGLALRGVTDLEAPVKATTANRRRYKRSPENSPAETSEASTNPLFGL